MITGGYRTFKHLKGKIAPFGNVYLILFLRLLLVMVLLSMCRIGFYFFNTDFFPDMSIGHFLWLMWGGLRFDLVALLYFNLLYIVLLVVPFDLRFNPVYTKGLAFYFLTANGFLLAINVADFIYYRFTLHRTTADIFRQFRNENNIDTLWFRFLTDYWYALVFWLMLMVLLVVGLSRTRIIRATKSPAATYLVSLVSLPLLGFLIWAGIRGGYRHSTRPITLSNAGEYVKDPKDINIVLNTPFSIIRTMGKTNLQKVNFFAEEEAERIFSPIHLTADTTPFRNENVVVILLESFSMEFCGAYNKGQNGNTGYTPFLDSLIRYSTTYQHSFANGRKSIDALPAVLAGIPSLGVPYVLSPYSGNKINSIPSLLKKKNYHTSFFHGAPNGSMGFQAFANLAGVDHYYGMDEYDNDDDFDGIWGIWDEPFLNFYADKLNTFRQPFFSAFFSVSSHHPFEIPPQYTSRFRGGPMVIHKCVQYTDHALKKFFSKVSTMPWYKNTLFVITADHTSSEIEFAEGKTGWGLFSIPLILFKPDHSLVGMQNQIAEHTDIMPTVLSYLNYDSAYVAFGNDLLHNGEQRFSLTFYNNIYQYIEGDYLLQFDGRKAVGLYNFKTDKLMKRNVADDFQEVVIGMETKVKAIIQQYNNRVIEDRLTAYD
jgi:hypothetical protein